MLWRCNLASGEVHRSYLNKGWAFVAPLGISFWMIAFALEWKHPYLYPIFLYINFYLCKYIDPDSDLFVFTHSESSAINDLKKYHMGLLGAVFVAYFLIYAYFISLVGGHRSVFSHGHIIGTIGRMIFFNIPGYWFLLNFYSYGLANWNWVTSIGLYESTKMQVWLFPYVSMQFFSWLIGDEIHLLLDSKWAKGRLYTPKQNRRTKI